MDSLGRVAVWDSPESVHTMMPTAMESIDLPCSGSDIDLLRRHPPEWTRTTTRKRTGSGRSAPRARCSSTPWGSEYHVMETFPVHDPGG